MYACYQIIQGTVDGLIIDCGSVSVMRRVVDNLVILGHVLWIDISGLRYNHRVEKHVCNDLL